jgi:protein-S-isoprenylcysteine O-methyltransferase Ste14
MKRPASLISISALTRFVIRFERRPMVFLLRTLVSVLIPVVVVAGVIFGLAGRWDVWNVWAYAGIFVVLSFLQTLAIYRKSPDLLKERFKPAALGRLRWTTHRAFLVVSILQWSIAGLDQRFHWSDIVPPAGVLAGLVIFAIGWGLLTWSTSVNPFFSPEIRIQADRGQRVISNGPYTIVRHPGYANILLGVIACGLALNSLLAIIPAVIYGAITVRVTAIEDRMLHDELAGYADYAAKVCYRLIPGIW